MEEFTVHPAVEKAGMVGTVWWLPEPQVSVESPGEPLVASYGRKWNYEKHIVSSLKSCQARYSSVCL